MINKNTCLQQKSAVASTFCKV